MQQKNEISEDDKKIIEIIDDNILELFKHLHCIL